MNTSSEMWQPGDQAVQVSHLEKIYWPQSGFRKGDLLYYYRQIAPVVLPHLKDRPVTLRMYPQGVEGISYYLRNCPEEAPAWLRRVQYQPRTVSHPVPLPLIDTAAGLLWFANQGAIEFHLWGSHIPDLAQPGLAIFDLDAGDATPTADPHWRDPGAGPLLWLPSSRLWREREVGATDPVSFRVLPGEPARGG